MTGAALWLQAAACLAAGGALGGLYFHGLRLTIDRLPASTVPLMMLPYRRTASAIVREISPTMLNGSISGVGRT